MDIEKRVAQYVQLRDLIKEKEAAHKKELEPFKGMLEKLGALLLDHLNASNSDSASSKAGTVYLTSKDSASLADPDAFMRFVIGSEAWDLMDRKANSTAVRDFINEHGAAPPGVNFSTKITVGVRRA